MVKTNPSIALYAVSSSNVVAAAFLEMLASMRSMRSLVSDARKSLRLLAEEQAELEDLVKI